MTSKDSKTIQIDCQKIKNLHVSMDLTGTQMIALVNGLSLLFEQGVNAPICDECFSEAEELQKKMVNLINNMVEQMEK